MKNHFLTAPLKTPGPGHACVKEHEILCLIALTRALYDQMVPQICHLYVSIKNKSMRIRTFEDPRKANILETMPMWKFARWSVACTYQYLCTTKRRPSYVTLKF